MRLGSHSCWPIQQCRIECHALGRCRCEKGLRKRRIDRSESNNIVLLRSRNDIQQSYIREWQKTTARDGNIKPQTILSTLWFVPIWLKYHAVPDILRYAWYMVWVKIVAAYRRYHTWAVLQGVAAFQNCSSQYDLTQLYPAPLPACCACCHEQGAAACILALHRDAVQWQTKSEASAAVRSTAPKWCFATAGAQLDVYLANRSNLPMTTFSRSLVMQRYHHDVSLRENLLYRWKLYKVRVHYRFPLAGSHCQQPHHCLMEPVY